MIIVRLPKYLKMPAKVTACRYGPTNTYSIRTPIGEMELTCCPKGIHTLGLLDSISDDNFSPQPGIPVVFNSQLYQDNGYTYKPATDCVNWLNTYFNNVQKHTKQTFMPTICNHVGKEGTFTGQVWLTLRDKIEFGKTISYKNLGGLCGNYKACQAVGQAMRNNPVIILTPCHRVIQENGMLGNYSRGTKNRVKEWLLRHEGVIN